MERPLKEHYEIDTDGPTVTRIFDYITSLEKYISFLEARPSNDRAAISTRGISKEDYQRLFDAFDEGLNMQLLETEVSDIIHALENNGLKLSRADL